MKKQLLYILLFLLGSMTMTAQSYQYGLVQDFNNTGENYEYTFVIVPDFANGAVEVGSVNITISISTGNTLTSFTQINGSNWQENTAFTATVLNSFTAGDGTRDLWTFSRTSSSQLTIASHTVGEQIPLFSFVVDNMPTTGDITLTENTDAVIVDLSTNTGGAFDLSNSFGADIDGVPITDTDYYGGNAAGLITYDLMDPLLSVDEVDALNSITISPNPAIDQFQISGITKKVTVSIYNINGQQLKESSILANEVVDITNISSGVYFVKLILDDASKTFKIVKR
ncbi:T9SS type A sorting domain-containing protein [Aquimarina sp. MMG016]|uniref:T9SS type A sorting domain-containing protein n=1 Tax=Aquimarina sp. MMG016 TaxID=2822690 RepID=UPI001B3A3E7D|nr:T9SS type A sorting domain-containing protein [Aquimarina sp. MMG016]MBQ4821719.1 T9SS type A sorting domain-containing protein [Aquimarina sp. MMG016]